MKNFILKHWEIIISIILILWYVFVMEYFISEIVSNWIYDLLPINNYTHDQLQYYSDLYNETGNYDTWPLDLKNIAANRSSWNNIIAYLSLGVIIIPFTFKKLKTDVMDFSSDTPKYANKTVISIGIYYAIIIFGNMAYQALLGVLKKTDLQSENQVGIDFLLENADMFPKILMVIAIVIIAPIVEEIIYRKCFFSICKNSIVALIVSSLIFGLMHNYDNGYAIGDLFLVSIPYFLGGIALGIAYIKGNRNLLIPIAIHILNNLISTFASL